MEDGPLYLSAAAAESQAALAQLEPNEVMERLSDLVAHLALRMDKTPNEVLAFLAEHGIGMSDDEWAAVAPALRTALGWDSGAG